MQPQWKRKGNTNNMSVHRANGDMLYLYGSVCCSAILSMYACSCRSCGFVLFACVQAHLLWYICNDNISKLEISVWTLIVTRFDIETLPMNSLLPGLWFHSICVWIIICALEEKTMCSLAGCIYGFGRLGSCTVTVDFLPKFEDVMYGSLSSHS